MAAKPASGLLKLRAQQEQSQIASIEQQYARNLVLVPLQEMEPVGVAGLKALFDSTDRGTS